MYSTFRQPPPSVGQLQLDTAVARSMKLKRDGGTTARRSSSAGNVATRSRSSSTPQQSYVYRRQRTLPSHKVGHGSPAAAHAAGAASGPAARTPRARSAPRRALELTPTFASRHSHHTTHTPRHSTATPTSIPINSPLPAGRASSAAPMHFTPTKAELTHIRNRLATDKHLFVSSYPVPPSPLRFSGNSPHPDLAGSAAAGASPQAAGAAAAAAAAPSGALLGRGGAAAADLTPSPLRSPSRPQAMTALENELASVKRELDAEKQHSAALRNQAQEASSRLDRQARQNREEVARLEAQVRKTEATAALAVQDREQVRRSMAADVADLRRELGQKSAEVAALQKKLEAAKAPPVPPPPPPTPNAAGYPLPKKNAGLRELETAANESKTKRGSGGVSFSSHVQYREASPMQFSPGNSPGSSPGGGAAAGWTEEVDEELKKDLWEMFREKDVADSGFLTRKLVEKAYSEMEETFGLKPNFPSEQFEARHGAGQEVRVVFDDFVVIMAALPARLATETALCFDESSATVAAPTPAEAAENSP